MTFWPDLAGNALEIPCKSAIISLELLTGAAATKLVLEKFPINFG
jgi:hypothetical protein